MKKRLLSILLAISMLLCAVPQLTAPVCASENNFATQDPLRYGWQVLSQMDNAENLLFVYERLVEGIANSVERISVHDKDHFIFPDEIDIVIDAVRSDYPEFFWLGLLCQESIVDNKVYEISPEYIMDDTQISNAKQELEQVTALLLTGLEDKSDYEISKLIHDRLAAHMRYQSSVNDQTIYGALVEKKAVCSGYASAYQYLMQQAGIPAWKVTGSSINPATGSPEGHAWTLTCLDGNWYHTDLTWDDQGNLGDLFHAYLNVTTQQILEDHALDPFFAEHLPECTSEQHNYFVRNNTKTEVFDTAQVTAVLKANRLQARFYVTGDKNAFLGSFINNISDIVAALDLSNVDKCGYRILGREIFLGIWERDYTPFAVGITFNVLPHNTVWNGSADVTGGILTVHYDDGSTGSVAMDADMITGFDPQIPGRQVLTVTVEDCTEYFTVENKASGSPVATPGDFTGDGVANNDDVVALLWNSLFPEDYPLTMDGDLTGDGKTNNDDVVALLWHSLFPEEYPL